MFPLLLLLLSLLLSASSHLSEAVHSSKIALVPLYNASLTDGDTAITLAVTVPSHLPEVTCLLPRKRSLHNALQSQPCKEKREREREKRLKTLCLSKIHPVKWVRRRGVQIYKILLTDPCYMHSLVERSLSLCSLFLLLWVLFCVAGKI